MSLQLAPGALSPPRDLHSISTPSPAELFSVAAKRLWGDAMDIDTEQADLCHYAEAHRQRIDHLRARIDRSTRELRVHEVIRDLADNSALPKALRSLANMPGAEWASARDVRVFLAEYGVSVPAEWDIRVHCTESDFSVVATNRDDWFPANLSWSSSEGFNGRITNNSLREQRTAVLAADA